MTSRSTRFRASACVAAAMVLAPVWAQQPMVDHQNNRSGTSGAATATLTFPSFTLAQDAGTTRGTEHGTRPVSLDAVAVRDRQSIDTFQSLEDGQPNPPGHFEFQFDAGWQTTSGESDPGLFTPELKYTPDGNDFLRNMKLTLNVPLELGVGGIEGNGDLQFGWQQRWVSEQGLMPTLATLAEIRAPSGYQSSGVDFRLTGIVAKDLGPGTLYFNAFGVSANGDNVDDLRHFQWGLRTGYRWRASDDLALIGGYIHESSEQEGHGDLNLLEVSGEWHVNDILTVGPGIFVGLDDNEETPNFGAGVRLTFSF